MFKFESVVLKSLFGNFLKFDLFLFVASLIFTTAFSPYFAIIILLQLFKVLMESESRKSEILINDYEAEIDEMSGHTEQEDYENEIEEHKRLIKKEKEKVENYNKATRVLNVFLLNAFVAVAIMYIWR